MFCKNNISITIVFLVLSLAWPGIAHSQSSPVKPQQVEFKSGKRDAKLYYHVQYRMPGNDSAYLLYRNGYNKNQRQLIRESNVTDGFVEIGIKEVSNMRSQDKVFIRNICVNSSDHLQHMAGNDIEITSNGDNLRKNIRFKIVAAGDGLITVDFGRCRKSKKIENESCNAGTIVFKYSIVDQPSKNEQPDYTDVEKQELTQWNNVDETKFTSVCRFLNKYPDGKFSEIARQKLVELEKKLWQQAQIDIGYHFYIKQTEVCPKYALNLEEARRRFSRPISPTPEPPPVKPLEEKPKPPPSEELLDSLQSEEEIANYILSTNNPTDLEEATQKLLKNYPDLDFNRTKTGQTFLIQVKNPFFSPRYKDISLWDGLEIDDSNWQSNHRLDVKMLHANREYKILIRDDLGREAVVPLGSAFIASMAKADSAYIVKILGGKTPYQIELRNNESGHFEKYETSKEQIVFEKQDLLDKGFEGQYAVLVSYESGPEPQELSDQLYFEKPKFNKMIYVWILLLLIAVIGVVLFFYLTRKTQQPQTIFNN